MGGGGFEPREVEVPVGLESPEGGVGVLDVCGGRAVRVCGCVCVRRMEDLSTSEWCGAPREGTKHPWVSNPDPPTLVSPCNLPRLSRTYRSVRGGERRRPVEVGTWTPRRPVYVPGGRRDQAEGTGGVEPFVCRVPNRDVLRLRSE